MHAMHLHSTPHCTCTSTCNADLTRPDLTRPDPSFLLTSAICPNRLFGTEASTRAQTKWRREIRELDERSKLRRPLAAATPTTDEPPLPRTKEVPQ